MKVSPESFVMRKEGMEIISDAEIISDEAKEAIAEVISQEDRDRILSVNTRFTHEKKVPDFFLVLTLYKGLVDLMITHIEKGENVATNSDITNEILLKYYSSHKKILDKARLKYNYAQIEAAKILLPHVKDAPLEDVLEIRYKANDELLELRSYIETTLKSIDNERLLNSSNDEISNLLDQKITPSIRQFERKLQGLNVFTAQEFIKNMKDPKSYAPLLTTFFANVPANASLGFSIGIITLQTLLQRKAKKLEIQNDPLYFTIKL